MDNLTARDALEYVLSRDVLLLIGTVLAGGLISLLGSSTFVGFYGGGMGILIRNLFSAGLVIFGIGTQVTGTLALLYKLIADATSNG